MLERTASIDTLQLIRTRQSEPIHELPGFRGVSYNSNEQQAFLLDPAHHSWRKEGVKVLQNTAHVGNFIGHMAIYDALLSPSANIRELPVSQAWLNSPAFLAQVIREFDVIMFRGGKHLGPQYAANIQEDPTAVQFHGYDDEADKLDALLMKLALHEPEMFVSGVCRGFEQVLATVTGLPPQPIVDHAPIPPSEEMVLHPVENVFAKLYGSESPVQLPKLTMVNSYHSQGYPLPFLAPQQANLAQVGWFVTHVHPQDQTVEMMIRLSADATNITGVATQFHPERLTTSEGEHFRTWNASLLLQKQHI